MAGTSLSWQQVWEKAQVISGDITSATLIQLKQDINTGYQRFNAATSRYFTRKQKFADIVANQQYYQIPVDAIRVSEVVIAVSSSFSIPLEQVRSEHEWRYMNEVNTLATNWPSHYWVSGSNQIGIFPTPSQNLTNGFRYVYQPQDVDLTKDDYSTGTVSITADGTTVTGTSTVWTSTPHAGMYLEVTNGSDGNQYEVDTVAGNTSLTLVTPYAGPTVSNASYKLVQLMIIPGEYSDIPLDYAMMRFFESRNNPNRAKYHQVNFESALADAEARYSSSSTSQVITEDFSLTMNNPWVWPPNAN